MNKKSTMAALAVLLVVAVGVVSGALPALQAYRLENIVALRKVA